MIIRAGWAASAYHKYVDETVRAYSNAAMAQTNGGYEDVVTDVLAKRQQERQMGYVNDRSSIHELHPASAPPSENTVPDRYNDTSIQAMSNRKIYSIVNPPITTNNNDGNYRNQNDAPNAFYPSALAIKTRNNENANDALVPRKMSERIDRDIEHRLSHFTQSNGEVVKTIEPLKDDDYDEIAIRQQQQQPVFVLPPISQINRSSSDNRPQPPRVPPKPNNRRSMQNGEAERKLSGVKVDRSGSAVHAPAELRGQLPWSYFNSRDDAPKKAFTELREDEDLPPVPVPDYTLHFPRSRRTNLNDSDGDGNSWNGQEMRY